jgi:hypothetical protein
MFVCYPVTILIYLGHFFRTGKWGLRIFHFFLWVILFTSVELINLHLGLISHANAGKCGIRFHSIFLSLPSYQSIIKNHFGLG